MYIFELSIEIPIEFLQTRLAFILSFGSDSYSHFPILLLYVFSDAGERLTIKHSVQVQNTALIPEAITTLPLEENINHVHITTV